MVNALILLNCDEGEFNEQRPTGEAVPSALRISARKVDRVKRRFVEEGMEAALGGRQGRRPRGRSTTSTACRTRRYAGFCKNETKPWRRVGWVIPPQRNADFAAAMERVLDVYRRPYDPAVPVVCLDETPRQLIRETRTPLPGRPERPARYDYEYEPCGTCNVFMATEPLAGRRTTKVTERTTKTDWAPFVAGIAADHANADRITLGDGQPQHPPPRCALRDVPEAKALWDRFEFVYTPAHGSWMNVAEVAALAEAPGPNGGQGGLAVHTTDDARVKLKRLYPTFAA